jgi:hypothetical protein
VLLLIACAGEASDADKDTDVPSDTDVDTDTDTDVDTDTDTDTDVTPGTVPLAGSCDPARHLGGFTVDSDALLSVVSGAVLDGVVPVTIPTLVSTVGDCSLLRAENPFCDPPCQSGETCDFDGSCLPFPVEQDMGSVTVDGLIEEILMEPNPPGFSYYALGLSHPPYAPGDLVTLRTGAGTFPGQTLHGVGVEPLTPAPDVLLIEAATDLAVRWNAPAGDVRSTVFIRINIDQHGSTPVGLECEFADTGEGTIPGTILDELIAEGVTGIPSARLTRHTVDSVELGGGCMDFEVAWSGSPVVDVDGFTPCQSTDECPPGQTCNVPLEICE